MPELRAVCQKGVYGVGETEKGEETVYIYIEIYEFIADGIFLLLKSSACHSTQKQCTANALILG